MKINKETTLAVDKNRIGSELWIYTGEKNPKIITEKTGVSYSRIREEGKPWLNHRTGETIERRKSKENIWILANEIIIENEKEIYLNNTLYNLLEIIESKQDLFKEIFINNEYKCMITCYGYYYDYHIYFVLDQNLIFKIKELNLKLIFDLYSFSKTD